MRILVVDIDYSTRWVLARGLKEHTVVECTTLREAKLLLENERFDLVFVSRNLPDGDGFSLVGEYPRQAFIVITSNPAIDRVDRALGMGALGYIKRPIDVGRVRDLLSDIKGELEVKRHSSGLVLSGVSTRLALDSLERRVEDGGPIFVVGERGVGKLTLVSHVLGKRNAKYEILYRKGLQAQHILKAFDRGAEWVVVTFLERMAPSEQERLGAMLEAGDLPLRIAFLLREEPLRLFSEGLLPSSLLHLSSGNVVEIRPLRERKEEIPIFVEHFRELWEKERDTKSPKFDKSAMDAFLAYHWPGNVRELKERVFSVLDSYSKEERITKEHLPAELVTGSYNFTFIESLRRDVKRLLEKEPQLYDTVVGVVERVLLEEALSASGGNKVKAARLVGLHRNTIRNKLKKLFGGGRWT